MSGRAKLTDEAIGAFLRTHPGWELSGEQASPRRALARTYSFDSYAAGIAFVVRVGFAAEARDHHPDLVVGWRKVRVMWSTHDAGGITELDAEMAQHTDLIGAEPRAPSARG
jgi:4a-hydroxytetrahydrobiopterin dehydratase